MVQAVSPRADVADERRVLLPSMPDEMGVLPVTPKVWFVLPSRREGQDSTLSAWREMGYGVAVTREPHLEPAVADITIPMARYIGWPRSVSLLIARVMCEYPETRWFVTGGDDTLPDERLHPNEIAEQCSSYLWGIGIHRQEGLQMQMDQTLTFGVMQPTGDDWRDSQGKIIERVAGSPWIGREFATRMYHGAGPLYLGYRHVFADEELQLVAQRMGCFWQRPDLVHKHRHWARLSNGNAERMPGWAKQNGIYGEAEWKHGSELFRRRKAAGFPGHETLENGTFGLFQSVGV